MPRETQVSAGDVGDVTHASLFSLHFYSVKVISAIATTVTAASTLYYFYCLNKTNNSDLKRHRQGKCPVSGVAPADDTGADVYGGVQSHDGRRGEVRDNTSTARCPHSSSKTSLSGPLRLPSLTEAYPTPSAFSASVLAKCTGAKPDGDHSPTSSMVCISVKGIVFRVTPQFYGPGEPYEVYAGKDVTVPLLKSDVSAQWANHEWRGPIIGDYKNEDRPPCPPFNFTAEELHTLDLWEEKFIEKYDVVGWYAPFERMEKKEIIDDLKGEEEFTPMPPTHLLSTSSVVLRNKKEAIQYVRSKIGTAPHSIAA